jgi:hypothetical protein
MVSSKGKLTKKIKKRKKKKEKKGKQITYLVFRDVFNFLGLNLTSMHACS